MEHSPLGPATDAAQLKCARIYDSYLQPPTFESLPWTEIQFLTKTRPVFVSACGLDSRHAFELNKTAGLSCPHCDPLPKSGSVGLHLRSEEVMFSVQHERIQHECS